MTPAEKRYFKMHFAQQRNALTVLYDVLNDLETYDENHLKTLLAENIAAKLKVYKVRLYERILKSLTTYHSKKSIQSRIRLGLEEVDILMSKQLYDLAADHLQKIKLLGEQYEEFTYLLDIAYIEFRLLNISMDRVGLSKEPLFSDMSLYLKMLNQQVNMSQLGHQLIDFQKTNYFKAISPEQVQWLERTLNKKLPELSGDNISFKAQLSRNIIRTVIFQFLKQKDLEFEARQNNVALFEEHTQFRESLTFNYLAVLRNYMNFCLNNNKFDEVKSTITKAKEFIKNKTPHEEPQLIYFYFSELRMYYEECKYDLILKNFGEDIEKFARKNKIIGERITVISIVYLVLAALFEGKHHQAQYYLRLLNEAEEGVKEYFNEFFILLELISHFEANDFYSLSKQIQRVRRKHQIPKDPINFFQSMVNWLDRLKKYPDQKAIIAKEMKLECNTKFSEDQTMSSFTHYHLNNWCNALINGTSLREELIKQLSGKN